MTEKKQLAMDIFIESIMRPDEELRNDARIVDCLPELMELREDVLKYLYSIRKTDGSISIGSGRPE